MFNIILAFCQQFFPKKWINFENIVFSKYYKAKKLPKIFISRYIPA